MKITFIFFSVIVIKRHGVNSGKYEILQPVLFSEKILFCFIAHLQKSI